MECISVLVLLYRSILKAICRYSRSSTLCIIYYCTYTEQACTCLLFIDIVSQSSFAECWTNLSHNQVSNAATVLLLFLD